MVVAPQADVVVVLTRAPTSGGKTRLFASLGCAPDPSLLNALLLDTLDGVTVPGVSRVVAVEPATACDEVRALVAPGVAVMPQVDGSLGARMRGAMAAMLEAGASRVAIVGSDLPTISPRSIDAAFAASRRDPGSVVLGPARDGGYYLVASDRVPDIFEGITWGSVDVLSHTVRTAAAAGLRVHLIDTLDDVDTKGDLVRLSDRGDGRARRTLEWARAKGYQSSRPSLRQEG